MGFRKQDKWKEPRNGRTSDAEKRARTTPVPMLAATGNGGDVVLTWNLGWREQKWRRKSKKATKLPHLCVEAKGKDKK